MSGSAGPDPEQESDRGTTEGAAGPEDGRRYGRSRPPRWWPDAEPWPPPDWRRHRGHAWSGAGPWPGRHGHPGRWRPLGCVFLLFGLFAAGTLVLGIWAAAAIIGLVEAPGIVAAGGIVAFVVIAVAAAGAARAFRRLTRPLDDLIEASARIEAGDYTARVTERGSRETRSLARAFNQMSQELEAADTRRRAFLADVTHELRTPLTVIQGGLEAIEDGVYEPDRERIGALLAHARQMSGLVEDLHTISLAEVGGLRLTLQPEDLAALVDEVAAAYAPVADAAGVDLSASSAGPALAQADRAATRRVLGNLVANALRHTPAGGSVGIDVSKASERIRVEVRDDGSGMSPELAARAFERFEKGPGSDGSGLGLAIARDLVEAQAGEIDLRSEVDVGTVVSLSLPSAAR